MTAYDPLPQMRAWQASRYPSGLTTVYRESFARSAGIVEEDWRDPDALLQALIDDPTRPLDDLAELAGSDRELVALDVGCGRAAKSLRLATRIADLLDLRSIVLHVVEPDPEMLEQIVISDPRTVVVAWQQTWESLLPRLAQLRPRPYYATDFHSIYYRPLTEDGLIESLAALPSALADPLRGFCAYAAEGPGQLQAMKQFMHDRTHGQLAQPVSIETIRETLSAHDIPLGPSITVPIRWQFPMTDQSGFGARAGEVFAHHFGFLLDSNEGNIRPPTAADYRLAGRWVFDAALGAGQVENGRGWLDGPDGLLLAGERYRRKVR